MVTHYFVCFSKKVIIILYTSTPQSVRPFDLEAPSNRAMKRSHITHTKSHMSSRIDSTLNCGRMDGGLGHCLVRDKRLPTFLFSDLAVKFCEVQTCMQKDVVMHCRMMHDNRRPLACIFG